MRLDCKEIGKVISVITMWFLWDWHQDFKPFVRRDWKWAKMRLMQPRFLWIIDAPERLFKTELPRLQEMNWYWLVYSDMIILGSWIISQLGRWWSFVCKEFKFFCQSYWEWKLIDLRQVRGKFPSISGARIHLAWTPSHGDSWGVSRAEVILAWEGWLGMRSLYGIFAWVWACAGCT